MASYNPDFWEVPTEFATLDRVPATDALYYETDEDRERRYAMQHFYEQVRPSVDDFIENSLTQRQKEVVKLYYFHGKTQEDIAVILQLTQSTVSRHLFGTVRGGKKVGGAIPKLRKLIDKGGDQAVNEALNTLQSKLREAV
jgi:predicted transcriptional regulator